MPLKLSLFSSYPELDAPAPFPRIEGGGISAVFRRLLSSV